jgi:hypothetical protein
MSENFKEFVKAEIREILASMNEKYRNDPKLCSKKAIEWIEENAEKFREQWYSKKIRHRALVN